jgi:hypothetical protein
MAALAISSNRKYLLLIFELWLGQLVSLSESRDIPGKSLWMMY